eukprot:CAMPEP_0115312448 /NCGR_PEP_ID=MMETSP0270-20121206/75905_1 /TAXON_ID=71861 /ORGANISM="Scrippsiella trochoidea, Strain CCMP3099" /LENGTH=38 /DNA_ID= /DNA_START= /DNA_END= /DNA_ORIENTATION=
MERCQLGQAAVAEFNATSAFLRHSVGGLPRLAKQDARP